METNTINRNSFKIEETLKEGWDKFSKNWSKLLVLFLTWALATLPFTILGEVWKMRLYEAQTVLNEVGTDMIEQVWVAGASETVLYVLFVFLTTLWGIIVGFNLYKSYFKIFDTKNDGQQDSTNIFNLKDVLVLPNSENGNTKKICNYLLVYLAYCAAIFVGFVLFIIPGIYIAVRYGQVLNLVVDKNMKVSDAFTMSSKMTEGIKWKLLGFGLVQGFLMLCLVLAGLICLIVGVFPAIFIAVGWSAMSGIFLYRKLYEINKVAEV